VDVLLDFHVVFYIVLEERLLLLLYFERFCRIRVYRICIEIFDFEFGFFLFFFGFRLDDPIFYDSTAVVRCWFGGSVKIDIWILKIANSAV
jgi:hypothetical protein